MTNQRENPKPDIGLIFAAVFVLAGLLVAMSSAPGCSPAPARNKIIPGNAEIERSVRGASRLRVEIRQPTRAVVPRPMPRVIIDPELLELMEQKQAAEAAEVAEAVEVDGGDQ